MGEETQPIAGLHRDIEELPHAELLTVLHENHDEQHLWDCIVAFEGYPFQTISGLPFSYQLKTGRNGELTKELWIDRRENSKSLAWSSVRLAFESRQRRKIRKKGVLRAGRKFFKIRKKSCIAHTPMVL